MKKYALVFKGPEGMLHFILDQRGVVYTFAYETIPLMVNFRNECAIYEVEDNKMYLISNLGFREDFPIRKMLTLNEQAMFARERIRA
jgi:hypothetical protein